MACPCAACSSVANRDVKFVMHQGTYIAQTIAGNTELLGPDVTTALQMLKNDVTSTTGWRAYALASSTAVDFLQIPRARGRAIRLDYEHVAPMEALVIPLE